MPSNWLSFWNDLLRNDYAGTGYIDGGRKPISSWLYRRARVQHALRRVRSAADLAVARVGGIHPRNQMARQCERQSEARVAVCSKCVASVFGHEYEVCIVSR